MNKYHGMVGFAETWEEEPGVFKERIFEKEYFGEVSRRNVRYHAVEAINDDVVLNKTISIVADPFAYSNLQNIRYITWMGSKWKVNSVDVDFPRVTLEIGGIYNGEQSRSANSSVGVL